MNEVKRMSCSGLFLLLFFWGRLYEDWTALATPLKKRIQIHFSIERLYMQFIDLFYKTYAGVFGQEIIGRYS